MTNSANPGHHDDRAPAYGRQAAASPWWKGLLSSVLIMVSWVVLTAAFGLAAVPAAAALGFTEPTNPITLLGVNLSWGVMILLVPQIMRLIHGIPAGSISSLDNRFRWGRALRAVLWALPIFIASNALFLLVAPGAPVAAVASQLVAILIVVLSTPLQAAGEEYTFRGGLNVSLGGWGSPTVGLVLGTVGSTVAFAMLHGSVEVYRLVFYVLFALAAIWVTRLTRGLEFAVAMHVVNNVMSFIFSYARGGDPLAMSTKQDSGPHLIIPLLTIPAFCALAWFLHRRDRSSTTT